MTARIASIAAALALSLGAASPVLAQDIQMFTAWGNTFNVPGAQPIAGVPAAPGAYHSKAGIRRVSHDMR